MTIRHVLQFLILPRLVFIPRSNCYVCFIQCCSNIAITVTKCNFTFSTIQSHHLPNLVCHHLSICALISSKNTHPKGCFPYFARPMPREVVLSTLFCIQVESGCQTFNAKLGYFCTAAKNFLFTHECIFRAFQSFGSVSINL